MRLLRRADLSLVEFFPPETPPSYAILSHRWGNAEVTLEDLKTGEARTKAGYSKLEFCANQATKDGIDYFWVDTCCINKSDLTELAEAINSMFKWYKNAAKCYVYLPDVSSSRRKRDLNNEPKWKSEFQSSEWFKRGWTLQELIAPTVVEFYSMERKKLGDKRSLEREICQITKIPVGVLRGQALSEFGIEERMSWVADRRTTKEEDLAYCLLGIFEVHMTLIYGEGRNAALARLRRKFRSVHADDRKCHQTFKTSQYEKHKNRNPLREPGTCEWVLSHSQFCGWRSGQDHPLLWISADPGCGKSVLCRSLIDQDLRDAWQSSICYFFFKDNGEQDRLETALCAILHQLFDQQPYLLRHARSAWDKNGDKLRHETEQLWSILQQATCDQAADPVICIFDALDECQDEDRRQLINQLCDTRHVPGSASPHKLQVLVTSRPYDNVQRWFQQTTAQWPQIRLRGEDENEHIHQEINLVIDRRVRELAVDFSLSSTDQQYLRRQLVGMEHRTYLWLHLAMEEVREACQDNALGDSLEIKRLPSTVEDAYERVLGKIKRQRQRENALLVLLIIVGARRPLTIGEMAMALSAAKTDRDNARKLVTIDAIDLEERIREQCGLFVYTQQSRLFLIHQTAKEFLIANSTVLSDIKVHWRSSMSVKLIETQMARLCMTYLYLRGYQKPSSDSNVDSEGSILTKTTQESPEEADQFFRYCAENWTSHLQNDMLSGQDQLLHMALWLYRPDRFPSKLWFRYAWKALKPSLKLPEMQIQHAIAIFGHTAVLEKVCSLEVVDLEQNDSTGRTALRWAVERGHSDLVKLLLHKNVNVNAQGGVRRTALQAASAAGHEQIVQILLEAGAEVNARGGGYGNALQMASWRGHEQIVQILLEAGAEVNAQGGWYGNAIQAASANGHEQVVQILLEAGADIYAQGGFYGNAVQAASEEGHEQVVQILLEAARNDLNFYR